MANKRLNIEIGERLTKVCLVKQQGKGVQATESFTFATPEDCVVDGEIVKASELADALKAHLEHQGIQGVSDMIVVLDSSKFASREVMLPPVKKKVLDAVIQENVGQYFPVDLVDYKVAYKVLEEVKGENPGTRVQVTIAPNSILLHCVRFAEAAGIRLAAIDYMGNSQFQVLKNLGLVGISMCVNVGISRTLVTFIEDGKLILQRNIPVGGAALMKEVLKAEESEGVDFYNSLKRAEDSAWLDANGVKIGEAELTRFAGSIARSLDYFQSASKGATINRVVLLGPGANIVGVHQALTEAANVETKFLADVDGLHNVIETEFPEMYASCLGSTMGYLALLTPEMMRRIKVTSEKESVVTSIRLGILVLIIGSVVGGVSAALSVMQYDAAQAELDATQKRIEELAYVEEVYTTSLVYDAMEANLKVLGSYGLENNNASLKAFIEELEEKVPSNLIALSADCTNYSVSMSVEVASMEEAAVVISELRTFESLGQVQVSTIEETTDDLGMPVTRFTLMCSYNEEEAVAVPVQPQATQWETTAE